MSNHAISQQSHGIMFHHFHSDQHPAGQGSLSADQFSNMLDWLAERYTIINAEEYLYKLHQNALETRDICLTFDDALLCQADIAVPLLKKKNIQAYFFIYSSPFKACPDYLEVYRYFRITQFSAVDDFYQEFFKLSTLLFDALYHDAETTFDASQYLKAFPFYSKNDKWFRCLRDEVLGKERYDEVMAALMKQHHFDPKNVFDQLWMKDSHLRAMKADGHLMGLHSFSHPTVMHKLSAREQAEEYHKNNDHLLEILGKPSITMSHPCGNYNHETLKILTQMGVQIGFRSNMSVTHIQSPLEIPRQDHANILAEMSR